MKAILSLFVVATLSTLTGCAGMADASSKMAGLGVVKEDVSTFDGATIVEVTPNWLYDPNGSWGNSVKIGARWSSNAPEYGALVLSHNSNVSAGSLAYLSLTGIDLNIDGETMSFTSGKPTNLSSSTYNTVSKTIYTESKNSVVVPFSIIEKMVSAEDCRIRIHTEEGYEDAIFSTERIPGGQGTAILSFREFLGKVSEVKAQG